MRHRESKREVFTELVLKQVKLICVISYQDGHCPGGGVGNETNHKGARGCW